jgi:hypothetical protein
MFFFATQQFKVFDESDRFLFFGDYSSNSANPFVLSEPLASVTMTSNTKSL